MNPLELRTKIRNALASDKAPLSDIAKVSVVSPQPGRPVALEVETTDPLGQPRRYRVTVEEI